MTDRSAERVIERARAAAHQAIESAPYPFETNHDLDAFGSDAAVRVVLEHLIDRSKTHRDSGAVEAMYDLEVVLNTVYVRAANATEATQKAREGRQRGRTRRRHDPVVVVPARLCEASAQPRRREARLDMTPGSERSNGDPRPEMPEAPKVRILVSVDYYGDGVCVAEAISHHRACSAVVESFDGGPTGALRALADEIDRNEDHYSRVPD